jgi:SAM-dependent methyltransferase
MMRQVARAFERAFLSLDLPQQIAACGAYELAPLMLRLFSGSQPVLDAGCGSGRWVGWLIQNGIAADGVDWSERLCARAARQIPGGRFVACDLARTPFADGAYGAILALGSIEHIVQGPGEALAEFRRLLRPAGIAVITVPFGGLLRRTRRRLERPLYWLKSRRLVRRLFGRRTTGTALADARRNARAEWFPRFSFGQEGWEFYEYEFNRRQLRGFLDAAGFRIQSEFICFGNEGILHTLGRLAGRWNPDRNEVELTPFGRLLRALIPVSWIGHMLCCIIVKE